MSAWPADPPELIWLWAGVSMVVLAALRSSAILFAGPVGQSSERWHWILFAAAMGLIAAGITLRWARLGHGPFLNMFEILASSLLSLGLIYAAACRVRPLLRATAPLVLPGLAVMGLWLITTSPADTRFPPTYETPVLWFHVLLGKMFLGCALLATGLAGIVLLRPWAFFRRAFGRLPGDQVLDSQAWALMLVALVFESLMLIAGAVWAQDAWGRYWDWDPLETWAFMTWLLLTASVHARSRWALGPQAGAWMIVAVFVLAFLTFFGVPFVSLAPHKGAV